MCGITGYISDQPWNASAMTKSLHHRGPDHDGGHQEDILSKSVFLGHSRLSIIDLSDQGHQPMYSEDRQVVLVFNGEIYNFPSLKQQHLQHESFHSKTDTEVVLKLYLKFGISFIAQLNGDFAMALLDKRIGKLYLIRDRMGVKPLYYYHQNGSLIFGSEIKSIVASGIRAEFNEAQLSAYFVFKYVPKQHTLHRHIYRVTPGRYIEYDWQKDSLNEIAYWNLDKKTEYTRLSYRDAKDELYRLIEDSTKIRLMSDVPIGNFLSGGIDSSILAYFLKDREDIHHYCARKSEKDLKKEGTTSDFFYAERLAKEWHLHLSEAHIGSDEANLDLIRKTLSYSDDLIADGSQIPSYLITQEASKTSRVILSGMGADEILLGYAGHQLTLLCSQYFDKMPGFMAEGLYSIGASVNQGKGKFLAYRRYIHKIGKYGNYPRYKYGILNLVGDFENSCAVYQTHQEDLKEMLNGYFPEEMDEFDALAQFEKENVLVKNLHYMDRMSMANSVECRVPFLDHRVVEFAYSIPRSYKLSNTGTTKKILKDTFQHRLPEYIIKRRKAGFGMPLRSIFSSKEKIYELLNRDFFSHFNGFSIQNIERIIENHIQGKEDNSSIIYALISFQEWYQLNF